VRVEIPKVSIPLVDRGVRLDHVPLFVILPLVVPVQTDLFETSVVARVLTANRGRGGKDEIARSVTAGGGRGERGRRRHRDRSHHRVIGSWAAVNDNWDSDCVDDCSNLFLTAFFSLDGEKLIDTEV
jgi:hypothetical protein